MCTVRVWKEQDVRRRREGVKETEAKKGCNKRKREKLRGQGGIRKQGSEEEMIRLPSWA